MQKITFWKTLLRCLLVFCALFQGIGFSPATAQSDEPEQDFSIYLAQSTFDPLQSIPEVPQSLTYSQAEVESIGVYILQFTGPVEDSWKQQVESTGGQLGPYIPNYAFLAKLDPAALRAVRDMPQVRWVGPYQAAYKMSEQVTPADTRTYRVLLAPWASEERNAQAMSAFAARPVESLSLPVEVEGVDLQSLDAGRGEKILTADFNGAGLEQAARLGDVLWIEPVYLNKLHNDIGGPIMGRSVAWGNGYTGSGQMINVTDSGLDTGSPASIHQDFAGRVANIASWPVAYLNYGSGCTVLNAGDNDGASDGNGHGTHVTGSVAGGGAASGGTIKGLAPNAKVNFQAVEQDTDWSDACAGFDLTDGPYLTGIPVNLAPMFQQAYNWGARIQNESWGGGYYGEYDDQAAQFDSFIASHQDFAVFVAAGNAGADTNENYGLGDGYVDLDSISSPATAKNVITIGATDNERFSGGIATSMWGDYWSFLYSPTADDYTSDNRQELAAFSSRGPMDDGRIKPDLVAPGTNILSTRSSVAFGDDWGSYNTYYHYMGGTSMASPLAAGAGTLVRQYYQTREKLANPSAALIKATLINTATDITGYGNPTKEAGQPIPNMHEGWGLINVGAATTPGRRFVDEPIGLGTGAVDTYYYNVTAGKPLKISLAWSDKPARALAAVTLVNNLNLRITAPNGTTIYLGNAFSGGWSTTGGSYDIRNNVENVYIQSPASGAWKVEVIGQNVPNGPQRYALVVDGAFVQTPADFSKSGPADRTADGPTSYTLTWGSGVFATSYRYCVDTLDNDKCDTTWVNNNTSRSVEVSGLNAGTTYFWQVQAVNSYGATNANYGDWWSFTTLGSVPSAFQKATPGNATTYSASTKVNLYWTISNGAASYDYCVDTSNNNVCDGTWTSTTTNTGTVPLTNNTTYYWQVRANNATGTSEANGNTWWSFTLSVPNPRKTFVPMLVR